MPNVEKGKEFNQPKLIEVQCPVCHKTYQVTVEFEDMVAWQLHGKYVQDAFPYLSPGERELLISGTCDPCFQKLFPSEEDG